MKQDSRKLQTNKDRIRELVAVASETYKWYKDIVEGSRYPSSGDMTDLPILAGQILAPYYAGTADGAKGERSYLTSGTTGPRKRVVWSLRDHVAYVQHRERVLGQFISNDCFTACASLGTGHAASSAMEVFERLSLRATEIDHTEPLDRHVEMLNQQRPDVFFTMPMILDRILCSGALRATPRKIIVVGDAAPPAWRANVARALGIGTDDILDLYGSIEVGSIAYFDSRIGMYRFESHVIPEIVPSPTTPLGSSGKGLLLLTSFARDSFPAIRYASGDLIEGFESWSENGTIQYGFRAICGRASESLKHGEKIGVHSIAEAINAVLDRADFKLERNTHALVVRINAPDFDDAAAKRIGALIREANPAVDQMIRSGLIDDIEIRAMEEGTSSIGAKHAMFAFVA